MNFWIEHDAAGRVLQASVSPDKQPVLRGGVVISVDRLYDPTQTLVLDGVATDFGPRPSVRHTLDAAARAWVEEPLTAAEQIEQLTGLIQDTMDAAARARGYDDLKTAITYRGDPNPTFAAEADAFFEWRSAVWTAAYAYLALVDSGAAAFPSAEGTLGLMPELLLP